MSDNAASYDEFDLTFPDASVHSHPGKKPTAYDEINSMGYPTPSHYYFDGDAINARRNLRPRYNYVYFPNSGNLYLVGKERPSFIRSVSNYRSFYFGTLNTK